MNSVLTGLCAQFNTSGSYLLKLLKGFSSALVFNIMGLGNPSRCGL